MMQLNSDGSPVWTDDDGDWLSYLGWGTIEIGNDNASIVLAVCLSKQDMLEIAERIRSEYSD